MPDRAVRVAILAAMPQEMRDLRDDLVVDPSAALAADPARGSREFLAGRLWGVPVVLAWTRWGKVAAAVTATHVLATYAPDAVIFTGVAGSLDPAVGIGDVVVADSLVQHDMDATPLFARHEIPLLGASELAADATIHAGLLRAAEQFIGEDLSGSVPSTARSAFGIRDPRVHAGQIATGDRFVNDAAAGADIRLRLPRALCVEMEGAAVAQVCHEHAVPCGVVRVISDRADDHAGTDFASFLQHVASAYTHGILRRYLADAVRG